MQAHEQALAGRPQMDQTATTHHPSVNEVTQGAETNQTITAPATYTGSTGDDITAQLIEQTTRRDNPTPAEQGKVETCPPLQANIKASSRKDQTYSTDCTEGTRNNAHTEGTGQSAINIGREVPAFLQVIGYPKAPKSPQAPSPLEDYDIDAASVQLELISQTHTAVTALDTTKWPFPHPHMDGETARIYDTVKSSGRHNHEHAHIKLPTALNIEVWKAECTGHPQDREVMQGIQHGFPIQYAGPPIYESQGGQNHASATNYPAHIQSYIEEEIAHGAMEGPFPSPPFTPWCVVSPLMTREKADSHKRRIIVDLSFPEGGVNAHIIPHVFNGREALHNLPTIESAVTTIAEMCPGQIHMAVVDLARAYRQFPVSPLDWPLLAIKVANQYYFDRRLPFGGRLSSYTMQMVADFIVRCLTRRKIRAHTYLDDIVIISATPQLAKRQYEVTLGLINDLGLQAAHNKLQPPAQIVKWLGINIDTKENILSIPEAKLEEIKRCMAAAAKKTALTKKQLQRIIGLANHLAKVIRATRVFIGRILAALRAAKGDTIPVSRLVRADLRWFARYVSSTNGRAILPHNRVVLRVWADACLDGGGASDGTTYYTYKFPNKMAEDHHITQLEAINCMAAARSFVTKEHAGGMIELHCDNKSTTDALRSGRARDVVLAACTRALWYKAAETGVAFRFTHVPGEEMALPDALSRAYLDNEHRDLANKLVHTLGLKQRVLSPATFSYAAFL